MAAYAKTVSKNAKRWLAKAQKDLDTYMASHGYTEKVWHGTEGEDFNVFRSSAISHDVPAVYFTYNHGTAQNYAALRAEDVDGQPNTRQFYVNTGRVLDIDEDKSPSTFAEFVAKITDAYNRGYDSVRVRNALDDQGIRLDENDGGEPRFTATEEEPELKTDILIVFDRPGNPSANRIKAADPVTFMDDVDGALPIPLDMRADQSLSDVRYSVTMGKRAKEEARAMIEKYRPDVGYYQNIEEAELFGYEQDYQDETGKQAEDEHFNIEDGFIDWVRNRVVELEIDNISKFDTPKERKAALYWFCKNAIRLPEDSSKVVEAIKTAEKAKVDPFQFDRPGEILEKYAEYRPSEKPIDPDTVPELSDRREMGRGIVTYLVQDDKEGQSAMRQIINTHFGKEASPWCLLQGDVNGNLTDNAWHYWKHYNALPKRVAFKEGKLIAFMATDTSRMFHSDHNNEVYNNYVASGGRLSMREFLAENGITQIPEQWWDRNDAPHHGIPFNTKDEEGRTVEQELMTDGSIETTLITKGDPNARDGVFEVWEPSCTVTNNKAYTRRTRKNDIEVLVESFYPNGQMSYKHEKLDNGATVSHKYFYDGTLDEYQVYNRHGDSIVVSFEVDGKTAKRIDLFAGKSYESFVHNTDEYRADTYTLNQDHDGLNYHDEKRFNEYGEMVGLYRTDENGHFNETPITDDNRLYFPQITKADIEERAKQIIDHEIVFTLNSMLTKTPNVLADAGRVQTKRETPEERHSVFIGIKGADKAKIAQGRLGKALELLDEYEIRRYKDGDDAFDPAHDDAFRRDVYVKTGWWMGTDGMWRFEIADLKPKQRFGKTVGDGSMMKNGIMFADRKDHSHGYCDIESICRHPTLFKAYPELKDISIKISDPDTMDGYVGQYNPAMNQIEITWDMVRWHDDEMSNILDGDGLAVLTHELQHAVQHIEDFNRGGNEKRNGKRNYDRLAGEVEARNAESRMFGVYGELQRPNADEAMREEYADNYAPWQTEDVPQAKQILVGSDGAMRDQRGNPVARHSVRSYSRGRRVDDLAAALIASRRLAGKDMSMEDADKLVKNLGLSRIMKTADLVERANDLADKNREKLRTMVERGDPALVETLARQGYADSLAKQLDNLITGTAATTNPDVGAKVQKAIQSKATRDLMNSHGFDAAQMMAELPVDLAQAIFAVAEYEKTPEELARIEAARKRREEERAAEDEMDEDEALAAVDDPAYREPTDDERAKLDALLDRARFMEEARKAEEERKKADKKRKAESSDDGSAPDGSPSGDAEDDGLAIPLDTVRRIAPVFESADLFASFIVEWTADHVADKHPNIPNTAEMWKNPVAVRELKQTATHILRKLAKDVLGSPSLNYARNFADHAINELESDAECRTFNAVRRKIARIYDQIHDHALSLSRRQMVKKLAKTIRQKAIERGRFSAVKEDLKRKIDAKTEQWCRWLVPALTMSEEKLQDEINRLTALVTVDPSDERATPEDKLREAADHLSVLHKYGGMVRWMPGRIADAEAEIMEQLDGKRAEFEARREERLAKDKAIRDAIVAAVRQGAASSYRKHTKLGDAVNRYTSAMMGNLTLEMQNLVRYCTDPSLRTSALEAIEEMQTWISEGGSRYRTILGMAQAELHEGLALCYGNAEAGIRHLLRDEIPTEAANAIFTQGKDRVPTYGQLLQLYASSIQADYRDNAQAHGRTAALPLMEATLTDADRRFHDWSVEWFKRNRKALSDSVEAVTGLPVTSPDALYTPVRILREKTGFDAEGMGWSPVPSALNRRILHDLDFNEGANFLACLQEQAEVRAQTIGYAEIGIRLRDTIAHRDVQSAVRKDVGKADMKVVTDHVRDVLVQNAARKDESAFWAPLNVARKWMARFYLSGNVPSALKQLASMPVWANAMIGGKTVGLSRCLHYLATVGTDEGRAALRELMASDGFKARYTMGWSEETQNVLQNPSKNRLMRYIERAYDKGMVVNKAVDGVSCLWMAQGFYRDATQCFVDKGFSTDEAKQKAMALTWSCLESGQQSGRVENMNTLQRRGGAGVAAMFQFKTAYLLQNNYLIQAMREMKAGTPGARGRFLRALFVNTVWIPAFVATVNAAWSAIMGEPEPPEDEETWPTWFKAMCWSMIDGVTAPMFGLDSALHTLYDQMTNTRNWRQDSEIPAVSGAIRVSRDAARVVYDLGKYGLQSFDAFDFEEELDGEKLGKDVNRLVKDLLAPYRHGAKAIENRSNDND